MNEIHQKITEQNDPAAPLVSMIVPMYNVEAYIESCLRSLLSQSLRNLEIIAVDDGSPDRSRQIAEQIAADDPHVKVVSQSNQGLAGARNTGLRYAGGKYVFFVDSDDAIGPDAMQQMTQRMEKDALDVLICDMIRVDEAGADHGTVRDPFEEDVVYDPRQHPKVLTVQPSANNKMVRRELIEQTQTWFPEGKNVWYEDLRTTPKWIAASRRVGFLHQPFYRYLFNRAGSIMNTPTMEHQSDILDALYDLQDWFETNTLTETFSRELEYLWIAHVYLYGINRIARIDAHSPLIERIHQETRQRYPRFLENPYLDHLTKKEKLFLRWIDHREEWKIAMANRVKKQLLKLRCRNERKETA